MEKKITEADVFLGMLERAEKRAEEKEKKQNDEGCPDCFCEDCDKDCPAKELGLVEK